MGCTSFASSDTAMPWPGPLRNGSSGRSLIRRSTGRQTGFRHRHDHRHDTCFGYVAGPVQHRCDTVPDTVPVAPSVPQSDAADHQRHRPLALSSLRSASSFRPLDDQIAKIRSATFALMRHQRSSTANAGRCLRVHADGAVAPEDGLCPHPALRISSRTSCGRRPRESPRPSFGRAARGVSRDPGRVIRGGGERPVCPGVPVPIEGPNRYTPLLV